ncbi:MAG: undecaprenyl/decaprenyl-phosphate alpha-N-acetylglucosaminyl 1-phosphate transferase [Nitrospirae bacterium]|nr:MAG: undecaprenyl/decaprenyl-phosphate alpha-N-acetylglucosaminyl 1-phosphate transferase [Nitrospirota bacterium]
MLINFFLMVVMPFLLSFAIQLLVIRFSRNTAFCIDCSKDDKPQRFHDIPTSRAGGVGIFFASAISLCFSGMDGAYILAAASPAFFAGLYEDVRTNIPPKLRLFIMSLGAVVSIILLDTIIYDTGLFRLPLWAAVPFSVFAITGVTNAINIIDGFNGLASGVSIISLVFFIAVSLIYENYFILNVCIVSVSAITGFFVLNFPKGKIFLGDGGAYYIGFILVVISILIINRIPQVSPLFPVAVLIYPIFEVLFSIYRRKVKRSHSPLKADRIHLHSLIHMRLSKNNPKTSVYILPFVLAVDVVAFGVSTNTFALTALIFLFAAVYIFIYRHIVRFGARSF